MKIAILNGSLPHYDYGVSRVTAVVAATLGELGIEVDNISLGFSQIPFFDGQSASTVDDIVSRLRGMQGIVLAASSQLYAPSAIMQGFLEYLESPKYRDAFAGKHCLSLVVSKQGGERSALEYLARIVQHLGGYDCARLGLQENAALNIAAIQEIVERTTEDFYRAVRQSRKYIVPYDMVQAQPFVPAAQVQPQPQAPPVQTPSAPKLATSEPAASVQQPAAVTQPSPPEVSQPAASAPPIPEPAPPAPPKLNLDAFTERQEEDIRELTALFAQKYTQPKSSASSYEGLTAPIQTIIPAQPMAPVQTLAPPVAPLPSAVPQQVAVPLGKTAPLPPRVKTVRQATAILPHYYQPQLAGHFAAVIQFNITGSESFNGYLRISESECDYEEGITDNPDITIIADTATWQKVLQGHNTAQKSFMIGGLKVRGNFMFLTKFDTLFKMPVL